MDIMKSYENKPTEEKIDFVNGAIAALAVFGFDVAERQGRFKPNTHIHSILENLLNDIRNERHALIHKESELRKILANKKQIVTDLKDNPST